MEELVSLLESVFGESEGGSKGDNIRVKCPFPNCSSVRKRLEISIKPDQKGEYPWKCWVCGKGAHTIKDLFDKAKVAKKWYSKLYGIIKGVKRSSVEIIQEIIELPEEFKTFDTLKKTDIIGRHCLAYLRSRYFTDDQLVKYQVGYCDTGRYANRVVIPSFDDTGQLNYFSARSIIDDDPKKYLNPQLTRGDVIPFELLINWSAPIILCEGAFDAIAIRRNAIPLLEKGITPALLTKILGSKVKKIYIVLDRDGIKEAIDHAEKLMSNGKRVYLVELPDKDPGKMGFTQFTTMIQKAKALTNEALFMKKMSFKLS